MGGLNLYASGEGNPLTAVDVDGLGCGGGKKRKKKTQRKPKKSATRKNRTSPKKQPQKPLKPGNIMTSTFGDKINKQMTKRGWTTESVNQTINNSYKKVKTTDTRFNHDGSKNSDPATAYLSKDGSYVVRNDNTGDIVQVSNRNDSNWKSPFEE